MLLPSLLACLAPLALPQAGGWSRLELPELCVERESSPRLAPLVDGRHLLLEAPEPILPSALRAELSISQLAQLLEGEARRRGRSLALFSATAPLLVQGSAEDVALARSLVAALDAAGARTWIDLELRLEPGSGGAGGQSFRVRARSGDRLAFGERVRQGFLASFDVDVASNSGVASPVVGSTFAGATIHLRAARVDEGRKVHLSGLLDLADL